jgi:hypothetical protein
MVTFCCILALATSLPAQAPVLADTVPTFIVRASISGGRGVVDPPVQTLNYGDNATLNIIPEPGYQIAGITDNGDPVEIANPYIVENITAEHILLVSLTLLENRSVENFTITASIDGGLGSLDPEQQTVNYGDNATVKIQPEADYQIATITDNGDPVGITNPYIIENVTAGHLVRVALMPLPNNPVENFTVTASIDGGQGSVSPISQMVNSGQSAAMTITPEAGYLIASVTDNGNPVGLTSPYTIDNVTANHSVIVTFGVDSRLETLILRLASGLNPDQQRQVIERHGGICLRSIAVLRMYFIQTAASNVDNLIRSYLSDPEVISLERDKVRQAEGQPSDPLFVKQWALPQIGWDTLFSDFTPRGTSVLAVLDTGIDAGQPDLQGLVGAGYSAFPGSDPQSDPNGHGTRVAAIAAARTDNEEGIAGVAYAGVTLLPVQVLDSNGQGQDSDIINGLVWAVDIGADVILMSFSNPDFSAALQAAIDYAWENDVVLVAAAGNEGAGQAAYPAGDRGVMGISSTGPEDQLSAGSNYGQAIFLAAPGENILTLDSGGYGGFNGTSASAAIVAGAAAFLKASDPDLLNGEIVNRLASSADPAGTPDQTGNGRLNLARALAAESLDFIQPAGVPPLGEGGPYVGPYAIAATKVFSGPGNFSDPTKWSGGAVPAASDTLQINGVCTVDSATANLSYGTLAVGTTSVGTLQWPVGGTNTLRVRGILSSTISGSAINMTNGGVLQIGRSNWATTNLTFTPGSGTIIWANTGASSTLPAAVTTYNNLTIATSSRTVSLGAATTINGNLLISTGIFSVSTSNFALNVKGNFTNNATFTPNTGTVTLNGTASQIIGGTKSPTAFSSLTVNKSSGAATLGVNITTSANLTVSAGVLDLSTYTAPRTAAGGTLTVANGATLKIGGVNTMPANYNSHTFGATGTLEYSGTNQTVSNENYAGHLTLSGSGIKTLQTGTTSIGGNLTLSGTAATTTVVALTIGANLVVGDGPTLTLAGFAFSVSGTTTIGGGASGKLIISSANGTRTFSGDVLVNSGATWDNTAANAPVTLNGSLSNYGIFSAGTAVYTLAGTAKTLNGAIVLSSATINGTYTNIGSLTVGTALSGSGTLTQGSSALLYVAGTSGLTTLNAASATNSVIYDGADQSLKATTYYNLVLAGSGVKTTSGVTTLSGNLNIDDGITFTVNGFNLTVNGTTTVGNGTSGILKINSATGVKTFDGDVMVHSGAAWNNTTANSAVTINGSLTNYGVLNAGTGVYTFGGTAKTISGALSIPSMTVSGSYTNSGSLTVSSALSGSGALTQGASALLYLSGTSGLTTLDAAAAANSVNYNGSTQNLKATTYYNLVLSGSGAKTTSGATLLSGNLNIDDGITFSVAGFDLSVNGTTTIGNGLSGVLNISGAGGLKIFSGPVTLNSGGNWNNSSNSAVTFRGGITNNGTFSAGSGIQTFDASAQDLNGTLTIPSVTVTAISLTNHGILTITTALAGSGGVTNAAGATLNLDFGGTSSIGALTAEASANTVNYNYPAAQTVLAATYHNLTLSGGGIKTFASGSSVVNGTLSMEGTATTSLAGSLTYGPLAVLQYNGSAAQITGSEFVAAGIPNLSLLNSQGVTAGADLTVNGILNLAVPNPSSLKGVLDTAAYTLDMGSAATTVGVGDVSGVIRRTAFVAAVSYTFGNQYSSLVFANSGLLPSQISFKVSLGLAPAWKTTAILRTYDIIQIGAANTLATLDLHYLDSELNGNSKANLVFWERIVSTAGTFELGSSAHDMIQNTVELTNIDIANMPGSFNNRLNTLANSEALHNVWNGLNSSDWTYTGNWTGGVPGAQDDVVIPDAATTNFDPTLPAATALNTLSIQAGGILNGGTATVLNIKGSNGAWIGSGVFNPGTSTVVFDNASATFSGATSFYNLTISSGGALTLLANSTLRLSGTVTNNGTWQVAASSNTVEYNGASQNILNPNGATPGYSNLVLSGSGTKFLPNTALNLSGGLTLSGTASATLGQALTINANLSLGTGTTLDTAAYGLTLNGNFTNSGNFNARSSNLVISGSGAQSLAALTTTGSVNLTKSGGTATLTGNLNAAGLNLNGSAGTLNLGTGLTHTVTNLTLTAGALNGGTSTLLVSGVWSGTSGFSPAGGTVNFNGSGAQSIPGLSFFNLSTATGGLKSLAGAIVIDGDLTIGSATILNSNSYGLIFNGNFINNGSFSANASSITLGGTATQSIAGFTTTGSLSVTRTGGTATLTGNISSGALTLSGSGGTLNLGAALNHSVTAVTLSGGTLNGGSSTLNISGNWSGSSGFTAGSGTLNFNGNGAQTIPALSYFNLTSSSTGNRTLAATGSLLIGGTFTPGANAYTIAGSTLNFNGSLTQTIPAFNYFNLTSSSTGNRILASSGPIGIAGLFTPGSNTYTVAGSTLDYNGSAAQVIPVFSYQNLTASGNNTKTLAGGLTVNGNLTIATGATLDVSVSGYALSVTGNWSNSGTFSPRGATVTLNGLSAQTISGTGTTFSNLTIGNSLGVSAASNLTVNGILNLAVANPSTAKGLLDMSSFTLDMGGSATTSGQGDVSGIIRRASFATAITYTFGNQYTRVVFASAAALPTSMSFKVSFGAAPAWKSDAIQRFYDIIQSGANDTSMTLDLHYLDSELQSNTGPDLVFWDYAVGSGGLIERGASNYDTTQNWVELSNIDITSYLPGSFNSLQHTLANSMSAYNTWIGSESTDWTDPLNWSRGAPPATNDDVLIPGSTTYDPSLPASTEIKSMTIYAGAVLNGGTGVALTLNGASGAWVAAGAFNPGSSTVAFSALGATLSGATNFYNLSLMTGSSLTPAASSVTGIAGTVTNNGVWQAALYPNIVNYNGAAQTIPVPNGSPSGYSSLSLSGSGTKTLAGALLINADLTINGGTTLDTSAANNYAVTLNGNYFNNGGIFSGNASNVTISGDGTRTIANLTTAGSLVMSKTGGSATLTGALNAGTLNINGIGGTLNLGLGLTHAVTNVALSNGSLEGGSSTLKVGGTWSGAAGFVANSGTIEFSGSASQVIPVLNYNNLSSSSSGSRTFPSTGTVGIAGTFLPGSNSYTVSGSTLSYNGSGPQPVASFTYDNLTTAAAGTKSLAGPVTVNSHLNIGAGTTLESASYPLYLSGNWVNNGSFSAHNGVVVFNGLTGQTLNGNDSDFYNLTINNSLGVTLNSNLTVNGGLNLSSANPSATRGALETGSHTLDMGPFSTTLGPGDVTGVIRRTSFVAGTIYTFGNQYTRLAFFNQGTLPSQMSLKVTIGSAPTWKPDSIRRVYEFVRQSGGGALATLDLAYLDSELNGNPAANLVFWDYDTADLEVEEHGRTNIDTLNRWVGLTSFNIDYLPTAFGNQMFTLAASQAAKNTWLGAFSSDWLQDINWSAGHIPSNTDDVVIPDAVNTGYDPTLPAVTEIKTLVLEAGSILNGGSGTSLTLNGSSGAWSGLGVFNSGTSTVTFTNGAATLAGQFDFYNLTLAPDAVLLLGSGAYLKIFGALSNSGTAGHPGRLQTITLGTTTVEYAGGSQGVVVPNPDTACYSNLVLSGSGVKTLPPVALAILGDFNLAGTASAILGQTLSVSGNLVIGSTAALDVSTSNFGLNLGGQWVRSGTFIPRQGTVTLNGATLQPMTGITTFSNLTVSNNAGVSLNNNQTITGLLTLSGGPITTGSNRIILPSGGALTRDSGYVIGNLQKYVAAGAATQTFEVGTAHYNPVALTFNNVATAGDMTVTVTAGQHPNIGTCLIGDWRDVNAYWTLTAPALTFNSFSATFFYTSADLTGGDPAYFSVGRYTNGWFYPATGNRTSSSTQATGITALGDFVVGGRNVPPALFLGVPASLTPQQQWTQVTATVSDPDTLADIQQVKITLFYDSNKSHPTLEPTTGDTRTSAILSWTRTGGWTIDQGDGATWDLNLAGCARPADSLTSGDWVFSFKVGKVATATTGASGWDIYGYTADTENTTAVSHQFDVPMAWYGEVSVSTVLINWGTVDPGSDFSSNVQTGITITYICNGDFQEQVMTTSPWLHSNEKVWLNTSGTPGNDEFSLKVSTSGSLESALLVNSDTGITIGTDHQTGEAGLTVSTYTLWLKMGVGILPDQYLGTIYFNISP